MLKMFKEFMGDREAWDMFVTGPAGTGKTTDLAVAVKYCIDNKISYIVTAYTHKACDILREKLPPNSNVSTLHKYLKKVPTLNTDASKVKHIQNNVVTSGSEKYEVVFIDEYSMIGEKDKLDLRALQDLEYTGLPNTKAVWIGDPYQLPAVKDISGITPYGDYCLYLTEIKRQTKGNPLILTIADIVSFIEGKEPVPLKEHEKFIRGADLVKSFSECKTDSKILLAYTNERVQELNRLIQGRTIPIPNDKLFSPVTKQHYTFIEEVENPSFINLPFGEELHLHSKYKTLEFLISSGICFFARVYNELGDEEIVAYTFGHYDYKRQSEMLQKHAAKANKQIETTYKGFKATNWSKMNATTPLARKRAKAWRELICFNDCVICLDFSHAMTVHKSQGSTYEQVFLDIQDLYRAAAMDFTNYLKLSYVAISRSSDTVTTN